MLTKPNSRYLQGECQRVKIGSYVQSHNHIITKGWYLKTRRLSWEPGDDSTQFFQWRGKSGEGLGAKQHRAAPSRLTVVCLRKGAEAICLPWTEMDSMLSLNWPPPKVRNWVCIQSSFSVCLTAPVLLVSALMYCFVKCSALSWV